jgi:hypothetical protein
MPDSKLQNAIDFKGQKFYVGLDVHKKLMTLHYNHKIRSEVHGHGAFLYLSQVFESFLDLIPNSLALGRLFDIIGSLKINMLKN